MARPLRLIGPDTLHLIETAPLAAIHAVLALRETEHDWVLADALTPRDASDDEDECRDALVAALEALPHGSLIPLDDRCRRIRQMATGKGPASLDMLATTTLGHEANEAYASEPDALCRSLWMLVSHPDVFGDAEVFHATRQYRDYRRMYDAFLVDTDEATALDAGALDTDALATRVTTLLALPSRCTVRSIALAKTATHPASIMLIVRHPGPLSSVSSHKDNGLKGTIYYRPSNEATLIWTPESRQLEVCADSVAVRQAIAEGFAEVILGQDLSSAPLTWRRYDLRRFRDGLTLPIPMRDDCEILVAQVIEIELRLGNWSRRLKLRVAIDDDIERIAQTYLKAGDLFRRAEGFSQVTIALRYVRSGNAKPRTLNLTVGTARSDVPSITDPDERTLGYALLDHWGILEAFRPLEGTEAREILPQLLDLYDQPEEEVSGSYLRDRGLDAVRLVKAGILDRKRTETVILIDEADDFGEVTLAPSLRADTVTATGLHGQALGTRPAEDHRHYVLRRDWLDETILTLMKPAVSRPRLEALDHDLACLGRMTLDGVQIPVYLARRLGQPDTIRRLDVLLRARQELGVGLILAAGPSPIGHLGPNVVVRLVDHLDGDAPDLVSRDSLEVAYRGGRLMALGGSEILLVTSGPQAGMLHVPGRPPLVLNSAIQIRMFQTLIKAHQHGHPEVRVGDLREGRMRSPGDAFHAETRDSVIGVYLVKTRHGFWRLNA